MTDKIHQNESPPAATGGQDDASSVRELAQCEDKGLPVLAPDERAIATQVKAFFAECETEGDLRASAFIKSSGKDVPFYERALYCERLVHGHHNAPISDDPASVDAAIKLLTTIAKDVAKASQPAVICPPLVLLKPGEKAALENIIYAPAYFLDADNAPTKTLREAEDRLGPATFIVASGSDWVDPLTGEVEAKRHAYWLFTQAARTPTEIARVIDLFKAAKRMFAGADKSITPVHGMRLWGTSNKKSLYVPRSCLLIEERPFERIDIAVAEAAFLGKAAPRTKKPAPVPLAASQTELDFAATAQADTSDAALIGGLLRGDTYHRPLVALAYRSIARGMTIEETTAYLQTLMTAVPESLRDGGEPGRWQARYGDIPRIVASAPAAVARKRGDDGGGPDMTLLRPVVPPPPTMSCDLLKPLHAGGTNALEAWVRAAAECMGAPIDYVYAPLLACAASMLSGVTVRVWSGWEEPVILWCALVGAPSANKSPGLKAVLRVLEALQKEIRDSALADLGRWLEDKAAAEEDGEEFNTPAPIVPRLSSSDATTEAMADAVGKQGRGMLYALNELATLLANFARYSGGDDRGFWLSAYDGFFFSPLRLTRDTHDVERLAVSVVGAIQPERLYQLLLKTPDDGLSARFLWFYPDPVPVQRPTAIYAPDLLLAAFKRLYEVGGALVLDLDEDAREEIDAVRLWAREEEARTEGLVHSAVGKAPGQVVRIAATITLLDWAMGSAAAPPKTIGRVAVERARRFAQDYALPMTKRVVGETSVPGETRGARRLSQLIVDERLEAFTSRDIHQRERTYLKTIGEVEEAANILVQGRWLTLEVDKHGPRGGRPLKLWRVNSDVFKLAAGQGFEGSEGFEGPGVGGEQ